MLVAALVAGGLGRWADLVKVVGLISSGLGGLGRDKQIYNDSKFFHIAFNSAAEHCPRRLARCAPAVLILGRRAAVLEELARIKSGGVLAYIPLFFNLRFCTNRNLTACGAGGVPAAVRLPQLAGGGWFTLRPPSAAARRRVGVHLCSSSKNRR